MLLISDDEGFHSNKNIDDKLGERVDIPSVIIKNKDGRILTNYLTQTPTAKIVMSIKFISVSESGKIELKLFMRSDDVKSLHFFKEFRQYYSTLCNDKFFINRGFHKFYTDI
jgi:hypothetical protein